MGWTGESHLRWASLPVSLLILASLSNAKTAAREYAEDGGNAKICDGNSVPVKRIMCYANELSSPTPVNACLCTHLIMPINGTFQDDGLKTILEMKCKNRNLLAIGTVQINADVLLKNRAQVIREIGSALDGHLNGVELVLDWRNSAVKNKDLLLNFTKILSSTINQQRAPKINNKLMDSFHTNNQSRMATLLDDTSEDYDIENRREILLRLPSNPQQIAKYYNLKKLTEYVDIFVLSTDNIDGMEEFGKTYHPSRLMGINDMFNADSLIDLVTGLGVPTEKIVPSLPASIAVFTLKNADNNLPGAPTSKSPDFISRSKACQMLSENKTSWTIERDEDLTAPYAFHNTTWMAFDDPISASIKAKYALLRNLAGMAVTNTEDDDWSNDCGSEKPAQLVNALFDTFTKVARQSRAAQFVSLQQELREQHVPYSSDIQESPYYPVRVVDRSGNIYVTRKELKTRFECSRQGYFTHPEGCNRFYRCVKFDQSSDDFTIFEYDCPEGLAFDERWEVCVWPGSLPDSGACQGSSEIAPVPRERYSCPNGVGYFADPENCRWFFACLDHGSAQLVAYEFRCPYGLVYSEKSLLCDWPWNVPECGKSGTNHLRYSIEGQYPLHSIQNNGQLNAFEHSNAISNVGKGNSEYSINGGIGINLHNSNAYSTPQSEIYTNQPLLGYSFANSEAQNPIKSYNPAGHSFETSNAIKTQNHLQSHRVLENAYSSGNSFLSSAEHESRNLAKQQTSENLYSSDRPLYSSDDIYSPNNLKLHSAPANAYSSGYSNLASEGRINLSNSLKQQQRLPIISGYSSLNSEAYRNYHKTGTENSYLSGNSEGRDPKNYAKTPQSSQNFYSPLSSDAYHIQKAHQSSGYNFDAKYSSDDYGKSSSKYLPALEPVTEVNSSPVTNSEQLSFPNEYQRVVPTSTETNKFVINYQSQNSFENGDSNEKYKHRLHNISPVDVGIDFSGATYQNNNLHSASATYQNSNINSGDASYQNSKINSGDASYQNSNINSGDDSYQNSNINSGDASYQNSNINSGDTAFLNKNINSADVSIAYRNPLTGKYGISTKQGTAAHYNFQLTSNDDYSKYEEDTANYKKNYANNLFKNSQILRQENSNYADQRLITNNANLQQQYSIENPNSEQNIRLNEQRLINNQNANLKLQYSNEGYSKDNLKQQYLLNHPNLQRPIYSNYPLSRESGYDKIISSQYLSQDASHLNDASRPSYEPVVYSTTFAPQAGYQTTPCDSTILLKNSSSNYNAQALYVPPIAYPLPKDISYKIPTLYHLKHSSEYGSELSVSSTPSTYAFSTTTSKPIIFNANPTFGYALLSSEFKNKNQNNNFQFHNSKSNGVYENDALPIKYVSAATPNYSVTSKHEYGASNSHLGVSPNYHFSPTPQYSPNPEVPAYSTPSPEVPISPVSGYYLTPNKIDTAQAHVSVHNVNSGYHSTTRPEVLVSPVTIQYTTYQPEVSSYASRDQPSTPATFSNEYSTSKPKLLSPYNTIPEYSSTTESYSGVSGYYSASTPEVPFLPTSTPQPKIQNGISSSYSYATPTRESYDQNNNHLENHVSVDRPKFQPYIIPEISYGATKKPYTASDINTQNVFDDSKYVENYSPEKFLTSISTSGDGFNFPLNSNIKPFPNSYVKEPLYQHDKMRYSTYYDEKNNYSKDLTDVKNDIFMQGYPKLYEQSAHFDENLYQNNFAKARESSQTNYDYKPAGIPPFSNYNNVFDYGSNYNASHASKNVETYARQNVINYDTKYNGIPIKVDEIKEQYENKNPKINILFQPATGAERENLISTSKLNNQDVYSFSTPSTKKLNLYKDITTEKQIFTGYSYPKPTAKLYYPTENYNNEEGSRVKESQKYSVTIENPTTEKIYSYSTSKDNYPLVSTVTEEIFVPQTESYTLRPKYAIKSTTPCEGKIRYQEASQNDDTNYQEVREESRKIKGYSQEGRRKIEANNYRENDLRNDKNYRQRVEGQSNINKGYQDIQADQQQLHRNVVVVSKARDHNPLLVNKLQAQCKCAPSESPIEENRLYSPEIIPNVENRIAANGRKIIRRVRKGKRKVSSTTEVSNNLEETSRKINLVRVNSKSIPTSTAESTVINDNEIISNQEDKAKSSKGEIICKRAGLFRHPKFCNKFYSCNWDQWKKKFTLTTLSCPVHLSFDQQIGACNYPSKGPTCVDDKLLS